MSVLLRSLLSPQSVSGHTIQCNTWPEQCTVSLRERELETGTDTWWDAWATELDCALTLSWANKLMQKSKICKYSKSRQTYSRLKLCVISPSGFAWWIPVALLTAPTEPEPVTLCPDGVHPQEPSLTLYSHLAKDTYISKETTLLVQCGRSLFAKVKMLLNFYEGGVIGILIRPPYRDHVWGTTVATLQWHLYGLCVQR